MDKVGVKKEIDKLGRICIPSRKEIELTSPTAINFGVFRRIKPC